MREVYQEPVARGGLSKIGIEPGYQCKIRNIVWKNPFPFRVPLSEQVNKRPGGDNRIEKAENHCPSKGVTMASALDEVR
jgi:hypothetical protein